MLCSGTNPICSGVQYKWSQLWPFPQTKSMPLIKLSRNHFKLCLKWHHLWHVSCLALSYLPVLHSHLPLCVFSKNLQQLPTSGPCWSCFLVLLACRCLETIQRYFRNNIKTFYVFWYISWSGHSCLQLSDLGWNSETQEVVFFFWMQNFHLCLILWTIFIYGWIILLMVADSVIFLGL